MPRRASNRENTGPPDAAMARESEAIALMRAGQGAGKTIMRGWIAETRLHGGRLNEGQKEAVKMILSSKDRVLGVQGYAGTGKTTMLNRLRTLVESRGYNTAGLAPSASAARTLEREAGIESETVQRFLARHAGIVEGRGTAMGLRNMRDRFSKTVLVVDESSLASSDLRPCSSSSRRRHVFNHSALSKYWTGPRPRSTGWTAALSARSSTRARRFPISTSRSSKPSIRRYASSSAFGIRRPSSPIGSTDGLRSVRCFPGSHMSRSELPRCRTDCSSWLRIMRNQVSL